jgi:U3 small nucleolar RNA-associated protein 11
LFVFQKLEKEREGHYDELLQRMERDNKMTKITEELQVQKNLLGKGARVKVVDKTRSQPAVYKWRRERKK